MVNGRILGSFHIANGPCSTQQTKGLFGELSAAAASLRIRSYLKQYSFWSRY